MKERMKKIKKKDIIILSALILGFVLLQMVPGVKAASSGTNPVIYDSTYIDKLVAEINNNIKSSNEELRKEISAASGSGSGDVQKELADTKKELAALKESMVFKIIKLPAGKTLVGGESTEIIVRNKDRAVAYVEKTATGGVSNLISGQDIQNGATIPYNQLLLISKADGRGVKAIKDADIMVKGTYTIK